MMMKTLEKLFIGMALMVLLVLAYGGQAWAGQCTDACYKAKSVAYQQCRAISPGERKARSSCFNKADLAFKRCLKSCSAPPNP